MFTKSYFQNEFKVGLYSYGSGRIRCAVSIFDFVLHCKCSLL